MKLHSNYVLLGVVVILGALLALSYQSSVQAKKRVGELERSYTTLNLSSEQLKQNITALSNNVGYLEWKNKQLKDNLECLNSKGNWVNFASPCNDDSCAQFVKSPSSGCTLATLEGCDCGSERCWDGTTCVPNPPQSPSSTPEQAK